MKIRKGFVSNSSSSSFIIQMRYLSDDQLEAIHNHNEIWQNLNKNIKKIYDLEFDDSWAIEKKDNYLTGWTTMDNFNMRGFMEMINVNSKDITWDDGHCPIDKMIEIDLNELNSDDSREYIEKFKSWDPEKQQAFIKEIKAMCLTIQKEMT